MPPITEGQIFPNLQAFKTALREWAIERNWTPHILDSDSHRVRAGCRSGPDCPFRIRANHSTKRCDAKVTRLDDKHTCESFRNPDQLAHQNIKRAETGKLKFLREVVPQLMTVTLDTNVLDIIDAVEQKYGQKIPTRQAQKVKSSLTDRVKGPCRQCHMVGHTRRQCPQLRAATPGPGPVSFSGNGKVGYSHGSQDPHSATYADGGLEDEPDMSFEAPNSDIFHPHPPSSQVAGFDQPPIQNVHSNYGMHNGSSQHYETTPLPSRPPTLPPPVTPQSHAAPHPATPKIPAEIRVKASELMEQAASLMQQAAQLSAEAARLNASVASA